MRRSLPVAMVATLSALALAACSSGGSGGGSSSTPAGGESSSASASEGGGEQVTLEFWDMAWGPADTYPAAAQKLVDQFESENPTIKVNYTNKSWDNWYQTFAQAVGAGSAPDVSTGGGFQPFGLEQDADAILPLNDLVDEWKSDGTADDFTEGMLDYYKDADGNILAIPWATDIRVWFYRTDLLEQAGVSVPTTYDELKAACDTVHSKLGSDVYGIADGGTPHWTFMQGIAFGAGMFDKDGNAALTSPKELEALKYIASMGQGGSGCINPTATTISQDEAIEMFNQGKAAFVMDSPSIAPRLSEDTLKVAKVLPPLANADGQKLGLYFVNGIMAYKSTQHPAEVEKFISFWSEHGKDLFLGGASGVSPRKSIDSDPSFDSAPLYREAAKAWGAPVGQPLYALAPNGFAALNTIDGDNTMLDLERALFSGTPSVEDAAATAQAKVQGFVDEGK
jgi:multiple sugar transport system substrate-binding protein